MRPGRSHRALEFLVAVLASAAAALLRLYLDQTHGLVPFALLYVPAIAVAAWHGGLWPGLLATSFAVATEAYFRLAAHGSAHLPDTTDQIRLLLLGGTGALISSLTEGLRRARRKLERRVHHSRLMNEASRRMSGTLVVREIYDSLRELIAQAMTCDGMLVSEYDSAAGTVRCVYGWVNGRPFDHTALPTLTIDLQGGGMQTEVIRTAEGRLYANVRQRVRERSGRYYDVQPDGRVRDLSAPDAAPPGARCALMVPLELEGRVIGTVQVMSDTPRAYTSDHLSMLESLVAPMAVALQNAKLYERANREIRERTRVEEALTESEERLREADKRKDEFLATLAHELRNPLAPIRNAVALLSAWDAEGPEGMKWCREVIERQVGHMARLLDDLLDVSRISRGALQLRRERVELARVVKDAAETCQPFLEAGRHALQISLPEQPIQLDADPTRLAQVFSNLLNNAARYSESGRPIELTAEREGGEAVIRVRDQGIGISPAMLPKIFDAFTQIDHSLERSQGGLGIGLALVRQVVLIHGGRVKAESEGLGQGSVFTVRLPALDVEPAVASGASAGSAAADSGRSAARGSRTAVDRDAVMTSRRRILIAEDLEDSADTLARMLERLGHEVRVTYNGDEAVSMARIFSPEIVVLDIAMPRLNGYDAARRIRESCEETPIFIALTGWGHEENRRQTREAGFDYHLVKPVEPETLAKLLAECATRRRQAVET